MIIVLFTNGMRAQFDRGIFLKQLGESGLMEVQDASKRWVATLIESNVMCITPDSSVLLKNEKGGKIHDH